MACPLEFDLLVGIIKPLGLSASTNAAKKTLGDRDSFFLKLEDDVRTFRRNHQRLGVSRGDAMKVAGGSITLVLDILNKAIKDLQIRGVGCP
jgi:hypothetical protein